MCVQFDKIGREGVRKSLVKPLNERRVEYEYATITGQTSYF